MAFDLCQRHKTGGCRRQQQRARSNSSPQDPPTWPHSPQDQNATVAAFMIARGPSAVLELSVYGAYFWASDLTFPSILTLDYGPPKGPGSLDGSVYSRHFER